MSIHYWIGLVRRRCGKGARFPEATAIGGARIRSLVTTASAAVLTVAPLTGASAQQPSSSPEVADLPRYRIELVLFERTQAPLHPEDPGRPPLPPAQEGLSPVPGIFIESPEPLPQTPPAESEIQEEADLREESIFFEPANIQDLSGILARLQKLSGYRVLAHEAWIQPGFSREQAREVDLEALARLRNISADPRGAPRTGSPVDSAAEPGEPAPLKITATLWLGRYLHMEIDAEFRRDMDTARLAEDRRMRSGEVHYFDSPHLGAIAIVIPVEDSGLAPDDAAAAVSLQPPGSG